MRVSRINAISNKAIIGTDTKNSESGSGGENAAPNTNVANHMCLRYAVSVSRPTAPLRNNRIVARGAWNPITQAIMRLIMNPTKDDSFHSVDNPADCASAAR